MKKLSLLLLLLSASLSPYAQRFSLSDIPLTWANFRIVEARNAAYSAHVDVWLTYNIGLDTVHGKIEYKLTTECYVNNANSVVTKHFYEEANAMDKERCLQHEKIHFVIGLIQQKKFQRLLEECMFQNPMQKQIDSLFSLTINEMTRVNRQYDQATDHGKNGAQNQWEINLMQQLNELYQDAADFSTTATILKSGNPKTKITDPISYR